VKNQSTILTLAIMKANTIILASIIFICSGFRATTFGSLVVSLSNISKKGKINLAIYKEGEDLPNDKFLVKSLTGECTTGVCTFKFDNLPYGEYAIALYQDENANKKLDTGNFGIPSEPFAFSNNFKPRWGGPSFEKCKFEFSKDEQVVEIALINKLFGND
jgi:uncharacterized protein (DUF2141 family)